MRLEIVCLPERW